MLLTLKYHPGEQSAATPVYTGCCHVISSVYTVNGDVTFTMGSLLSSKQSELLVFTINLYEIRYFLRHNLVYGNVPVLEAIYCHVGGGYSYACPKRPVFVASTTGNKWKLPYRDYCLNVFLQQGELPQWERK